MEEDVGGFYVPVEDLFGVDVGKGGEYVVEDFFGKGGFGGEGGGEG